MLIVLIVVTLIDFMSEASLVIFVCWIKKYSEENFLTAIIIIDI